MYFLAIYDSGNYAYFICRVLEKRGYVFEVIGTPCKIALGGCSSCLKFPKEYLNLVVQVSRESGYPVKQIYEVIPGINKNTYNKVNIT